MRGTPILNKKIEEEKSKEWSPGEVKTYKLSKTELARYGKPENNTDIPLVINELDWKNVNIRRKKGESKLKLEVLTKNIDLQGMFKYRLQDNHLTIIQDNKAIKLKEEQIKDFINELNQVIAYSREA